LKTLRLCLVGFGNAGRAFCKMLIEKEKEIKDQSGFQVKVTAIATQSKGCLLDVDGIDLTQALDEISSYGSFQSSNPSRTPLTSMDLIRKSYGDVLVELSTLSITDGQPAINHIEAAFNEKMHVITGNKGPIAWSYKRLAALASAHHVQFLYETTVMDGTPIFNMVRETLMGCKILSFRGILNSTTNFILEQMEKGESYESAIILAQQQGFAEADPTLDTEGWDAAAKTAALANVLMNADLNPKSIDRTGLSNITLSDIQSAAQSKKRIKLICQGYYDIDHNTVMGKVFPCQIDSSDVLYNIDATSSIVSLTTDLMGTVSILEHDPEIQQTAYGIFSDLLTLIKRLK